MGGCFERQIDVVSRKGPIWQRDAKCCAAKLDYVPIRVVNPHAVAMFSGSIDEALRALSISPFGNA